MVKTLCNIKKGILSLAVISFFVFMPSAPSFGTLCTVSYIDSVRPIDSYDTLQVPLTILFTNDIHSSGDYARLATIIKQERKKAEAAGSAVVVVDAGDIAMGSVFQTIYSDYAFEYVAMGLMGYDAITCGNHDFDFGIGAFKNMLASAKCSPYITNAADGTSLPHFVETNLNTLYPPYFNESDIKDTLMLQKTVATMEGKKSVLVGVYGLMGEHAYSCIANRDSLVFFNRVESAQKAVTALKADGADYIIALSHGGTLWANGKKVEIVAEEFIGTRKYQKLRTLTEDGKLAEGISGTDAIISGHDHELLEKPLLLNNTVIGSAGAMNGYLGKIVMVGDSLAEYSVIPITENVLPDECLQRYINNSYAKVSDKFLNEYRIVLSDTIAVVPHEIPLKTDGQGNMALGFYIADSYRAIAENIVDNPVAIVPFGVIRKCIKAGAITNGDAYEVLSLGMSANGEPGYPLVLVWVTGKELYDICELNASVAWGMEDARLFFSGMTFEYNRYRIPFTRVTNVKVGGESAKKEKLYPIVTGLYTAQLIRVLKDASFGLLSVAPKDKYGVEIEDITSSVINVGECNAQLCTISEWRAFAEYIKKTELKNPVEKCSVDKTTLSVYFKYTFIVLLLILASIWLLRFGKRAHCRQP